MNHSPQSKPEIVFLPKLSLSSSSEGNLKKERCQKHEVIIPCHFCEIESLLEAEAERKESLKGCD